MAWRDCVTAASSATVPAMIVRRFRRLPTALRLLVLAFITVGLAAQPLLSALDDMHQTAHDVAAHDHFGSDNHEADAAHDLGTPPVLHELLHLAHCCGHPVAVELAVTTLATVVVPGALPVSRSVASRHELRRIAPFRPPIRA